MTPEEYATKLWDRLSSTQLGNGDTFQSMTVDAFRAAVEDERFRLAKNLETVLEERVRQTIQAAVEAEREACAALVESLADDGKGIDSDLIMCAAAIRARGSKEGK